MTQKRRRAPREWGRLRRLPSGRFQASYIDPDTKKVVCAPRTFHERGYAEGWLGEQHEKLYGVPPEPDVIRRKRRSKSSFVYFIQIEPDGPVKIGTSTNVAGRLTSLKTAVPYPLRLLATIPGDKEMERQLHQRHASDRLEGEWFRPSEAVLATARGIIEELRRAGEIESNSPLIEQD